EDCLDASALLPLLQEQFSPTFRKSSIICHDCCREKKDPVLLYALELWNYFRDELARVQREAWCGPAKIIHPWPRPAIELHRRGIQMWKSEGYAVRMIEANRKTCRHKHIE